MRAPKNHIAYPQKQILEVLRTLNELVVSLDQIGSSASVMTKAAHNAALADFIQRHKIFRKTARARHILSAPFPIKLGADEMDELERAMQNVKCWNDRKRK